MRFTKEERPQIQPGACSMLGIHEDEYFIRIPSADSYFGSFLLSKTAVEEIAKGLGYSKKTRRVELLEELKADLNDVNPIFALLYTELKSLTGTLSNLEELQRRASTLNAVLERVAAEFAEKSGTVSESSGETESSSDTSSSSSPKNPIGTLKSSTKS